jgi:hypothetical protein
MGTTPNRGWPYPESSDYVADGAAAIQNLAEAIDEMGGGYTYFATLKYTSSGTFVKANYPDVRGVRMRVQGGGGAGGGAAVTSAGQCSGGTGGGGGGYAWRFLTIASFGASETVTVGAGGVGVSGGNGGNGGTSLVGSFLSANGGAGGLVRVASGVEFAYSGGAGGTSSTSGTGSNVYGSAGQPVIMWNSSFLGVSGSGGSSFLGGGATQRYTTSSPQSRGGLSGQPYGGGGSGALHSQNVTSGTAGGDGANGIVLIDLYK